MYLWFFKKRNYKILVTAFCIFLIIIFMITNNKRCIEGMTNSKYKEGESVEVLILATYNKQDIPVWVPATIQDDNGQGRYNVLTNDNKLLENKDESNIRFPGNNESGPPVIIQIVSNTKPPPPKQTKSETAKDTVCKQEDDQDILVNQPVKGDVDKILSEFGKIYKDYPKTLEIINFLMNDIVPIIRKNVNIDNEQLSKNAKMKELDNNTKYAYTQNFYILKIVKYIQTSTTDKSFVLTTNYSCNIKLCIDNVDKFVKDDAELDKYKNTIYSNFFNPDKTDLNDSIVSKFVNTYTAEFGKENSTILIKGISNILFQLLNRISKL